VVTQLALNIETQVRKVRPVQQISSIQPEFLVLIVVFPDPESLEVSQLTNAVLFHFH
jgi:hypothetical protein